MDPASSEHKCVETVQSSMLAQPHKRLSSQRASQNLTCLNQTSCGVYCHSGAKRSSYAIYDSRSGKVRFKEENTYEEVEQSSVNQLPPTKSTSSLSSTIAQRGGGFSPRDLFNNVRRLESRTGLQRGIGNQIILAGICGLAVEWLFQTRKRKIFFGCCCITLVCLIYLYYIWWTTAIARGLQSVRSTIVGGEDQQEPPPCNHLSTSFEVDRRFCIPKWEQ